MGPIALSMDGTTITIVNPAQVLTAMDWAQHHMQGYQSSVWFNLGGLTDVVSFTLGRAGPLAPLRKVHNLVEITTGVVPEQARG